MKYRINENHPPLRGWNWLNKAETRRLDESSFSLLTEKEAKEATFHSPTNGR
jgi:hypothetical protein